MTLTRSLAAGLAAALLLAGSAQAGDLLLPDPVNTTYGNPGFKFEGFYLGGALGLGNYPASGRLATLGVIAGANFTLTDSLLAGVEFQGDAVLSQSGVTGANALLLGKFGGYLTDSTLLYATAGGGTVDETGSYALGAGVEQALTDNLSVRGEAVGTGAFGSTFDGGKGAVGLLWHMN